MEQLELPTLHYAVLGRAHARALDWHFLTHHHAVAPFLALVLGGVYGLWLATGPPVRGHLLPSAGRPTGSPDCDEISYIVMNKPSSSPVTPIAPGADERRQLVDRVLASRQFAYAHSLKRILLYLCEQYTGPNQSPKEYEIALQAMGRPASFDSRLDPIVRVSVGNIRERLASYFAMDGKAEPFRMELPKGQYRIDFVPRPLEVGEATTDELKRSTPSAVSLFWKPYFSDKASNVIGYTEPLFYTNEKGLYLRDWFTNDPGSPPPRIEGLDDSPLRPVYHYLSAGEVHLVISITRLFYEAAVPIEVRNSRLSSWKDFRHSNLILLGCPRTNVFMASLEGVDAFQVNRDHVVNLEPQPGEERVYVGKRFREGNLPRMVEYAVVTRREGFTPGSAITAFSSNHGRAVEGAGHLFTLEDRTDAILKERGLLSDTGLAKHFQLLMKIETIDIDDEIVNVECIAHRVLAR